MKQNNSDFNRGNFSFVFYIFPSFFIHRPVAIWIWLDDAYAYAWVRIHHMVLRSIIWLWYQLNWDNTQKPNLIFWPLKLFSRIVMRLNRILVWFQNMRREIYMVPEWTYFMLSLLLNIFSETNDSEPNLYQCLILFLEFFCCNIINLVTMCWHLMKK